MQRLELRRLARELLSEGVPATRWLERYATVLDTVKANRFVREHEVALAIGDRRVPLVTHELTADFTSVRFHHGRRGAGGNYSDSELEQWADRIAGWSRDGIGVLAGFRQRRGNVRAALRAGVAARGECPAELRARDDVAGP